MSRLLYVRPRVPTQPRRAGRCQISQSVQQCRVCVYPELHGVETELWVTESGLVTMPGASQQVAAP